MSKGKRKDVMDNIKSGGGKKFTKNAFGGKEKPKGNPKGNFGGKGKFKGKKKY